MRAARLRHWLDAKDPGLVAVKRALRVTLVACAAFYFSLYLLHDSQMASFASFGCIAFGALSDGRHLYRRAVAAEELAVWTRDLAEATKIMLGERVREPRASSVAEPFWYANRSAPSLCEMRRTARATLDAAANDLESTVRSLTHREVPSLDRQDTATVAVHFLALGDSTYAQYRSELRSTPEPVDWLGVLGLAHEVVRGVQALRRTHGTARPLPWPGVADELAELGSATAEQLRAIGDLSNTKI
jgi:hypothetical protein